MAILRCSYPLVLSVIPILCTRDVSLENKNQHVQMGVAADVVLQDVIHWDNTELNSVPDKRGLSGQKPRKLAT